MWGILFTLCNRSWDNLSVTHKFYGLVLLDCELTLNIVVSPEEDSSLLSKRCVACSALGDDGKVLIHISGFTLLPVYTATHLRRQRPSQSPL